MRSHLVFSLISKHETDLPKVGRYSNTYAKILVIHLLLLPLNNKIINPLLFVTNRLENILYPTINPIDINRDKPYDPICLFLFIQNAFQIVTMAHGLLKPNLRMYLKQPVQESDLIVRGLYEE